MIASSSLTFSSDINFEDIFLKRVSFFSLSEITISSSIIDFIALEKYEDSYAIAEEFREWILHIGENDENLKDSVLNFPNDIKDLMDQKINDKVN